MTGVLAGAAAAAAAVGAPAVVAAGWGAAVGVAGAAGLVAAGLGASVGLGAPAGGVAGTGGVDGAAQAASRATLVPRTVVSIDRRVSITDPGRITLPPQHRNRRS